MSVGSDDSLKELPLPFDISSAVSRALRISSSSRELAGIDTKFHQNHHPRLKDESHIKQVSGFTSLNDECCLPNFNCVQNYNSQSTYYHYSKLTPSYNNTADICTSQTGFVDINPSRLEQVYEFPDAPQQSFCSCSQSLSYSDFYHNSHLYTQAATKQRDTMQGGDKCEYSSDIHGRDYFNDWPWIGLLGNKSLWRKFNAIGTEMVVTKGGRRMFPHLEVNFQNLNPSSIYSMKFEISSCDGKRYKFLKTEWVPTGRAEKKQAPSIYEHPDSPNTGSFWMSKAVTFKMVKLTNNKLPKFKDQIILNSMQKYIPVIRLSDDKLGGTKLISFPETTFIAVTAYQNSMMTQMKIDNNPYARAFREGDQSGVYPEKKGGHYDRFRKSSSSSPSHQKTRKQSIFSHEYTTASPSSVKSSSDELSTLQSKNAIPLLKVDDTIVMSNLSTSNSLSYWVDDNSLWNPNLISPDPLIDSTGSFSEPYLQQTTQVKLVYDVTPDVKDITYTCSNGEDGFIHLQDSHCAFILDSAKDDDVFL